MPISTLVHSVISNFFGKKGHRPIPSQKVPVPLCVGYTVNANAYKFSFLPLNIPLWNSLPISAINGWSATAFYANDLPSI